MDKWLFKYPLETLRNGDWVFLSRLPLEVFLLAAVAAGILMYFMYRRMSGKIGRSRRGGLLALRVLFVAGLLFMLAQPTIQAARTRTGEAFTAVLVDTSSSMSIADVDAAGKKVSRLDAAKTVLQGSPGDKGLLKGLGERSRLVVYGFDRQERRLTDLGGAKADGAQTNIFRALRDVDAELRGLPLGAVVLLSDGGRNAGGNYEASAEILKSRGVPLLAVGLGNPNPPKDYEVSQVLSPKRVRKNSEVEVTANIRNTGFTGPFLVQIARGDTVMASKTVTPAEGQDLHRVKLTFTPDGQAAMTYRVSVPVAPGEAVANNNARDFTMEIQDDRLPVLYIEGSPRLEYRFLRRVLERDKDFRLVGLLRLAKDRFYVQGANDSEAYLEKGFPTTAEQLFAFQAVILGDIEADTFSLAQLQLLEQFVKVRGGGLIMLGGVNSFGPGKYAGTPVAKMLPLEISPADPPYSDEQYKARLADAGPSAGPKPAIPLTERHPVMQLVSDPVANKKLWENAPPLIGITPTRGVKVGGQLLLSQEKGDLPGLPVLAVQNYGAGRVAAFTSGGSWFLQMSVPAGSQFHEKFWKQLVRWLVVGAKEQLTVETDADLYSKKDPVIVKATVLAKDLKPVNDATVIATITDPLGNKQELPMDWILSQEGVYQCRYIPEDEGSYQIQVRVEGWAAGTRPPGATGVSPVGAVAPSTGRTPVAPETPVAPGVISEFRVSEPVIEFMDSSMREAALTNLAAATGGKFYRLADVGQLPKDVGRALDKALQAGVKPIQRPIWDMPILFAALVLLAGVEWFVRRRSGLA